MKVAVVDIKDSYSDGWISYLQENEIDFFRIDPYKNDVIDKVLGADVFLWHFDHFNHKDALCAKSIIYSVEHKVICFPNLDECFSFDDKLSQKYILEAIGAKIPETNVFFSKKEALEFINTTSYPLVAKLRKGAGSGNVWLLNSKKEATKHVEKSFNDGFSIFNAKKFYKRRNKSADRNKKGKLNKLKSLYRIVQNKQKVHLNQREKGYVLFQEYIQNDGFDLRALVINFNKVFWVRRNIPENDWSSSGVGDLIPSKQGVDLSFVEEAFQLAKKLNSRCLAIDYMKDKKSQRYKVLEFSVFYSYKPMNEVIYGYWDENLKWHEDHTDPQRFLIDNILNK